MKTQKQVSNEESADEFSSLRKRIKHLESDLNRLWDAVDMLANNCSCSVPERMSGHHVDCAVPHVREILDGAA